ncbi:uncharacterized protein BO88DRAFT_468759 [Aspergillus vadensis CBS 113365]|uniref:Uncharacterized protein n=1 Tax=Aspergillus vadensis (strain CBS 113365 / IMI 142717 / IBT 24658) TaxID=1448311 RepID=A0A319BMU3_ASPVC|nr:hypothetical protein BO88DRAFT_468759 [Aspergillus vadensis CBS 113365]PYH74005.1 hypothetical protein BO88DRAFT_468759 [Aspergillus vadensis CBS 113365]
MFCDDVYLCQLHAIVLSDSDQSQPNIHFTHPFILSSCSFKSDLLSVGQSFVATVHLIYTNLCILLYDFWRLSDRILLTMLPPSESILHQFHKLADSQDDSGQTNTITPPPPYSPSAHNPPKEFEAEYAASRGETDQNSLITIHIDASMSIQGNANSIILPSVTAPAPALNPQASPAPSTSTVPQSPPYQRRTKLTDMATSIITALHRTGHLNSTDNSGAAAENANASPSPSITLNINTGIKILGSGNVICVGMGGQQRGMGMNVLRRKRRASSEPPDVATTAAAKRAR